jgi:hypothetical protein
MSTPPPLPAGPQSGSQRVSKRVLTGLTCPSCGGTLDIREGATTLSCKYCETPLAVVGERGVLRLMVLDRLAQDAAGEVVRRWFRSGIRKAPALRREAKFEEAFLAWFPFVRLRFDLVGWVLGVNVRREKRGNRWVEVERPVELQIERPVDRTYPAAEMSEFGVHTVNLAGDELVPLDEETLRQRGMLFRPNLAPPEVARKLAEKSLAEIQRASSPDRTTFSWLATVRRRTTVVLYPLWVFRYSFRGRTYQALVDAQDGSLAYGKAPGNHLYRAASLVAATGAACFIGSSLLQHLDWMLRGHNSLVALGAVALALTGLVRWGYRQFRHGGIIEEGSGRAEDEPGQELPQALRSALERLR